MDNAKESKKRMHKTTFMVLMILTIFIGCLFAYYKYEQSKVKFNPEGFSVETNSKDIQVITKEWMEAYTTQLKSWYVPKTQRVKEYYIETIEIKEANVVQVNFSIAIEKLKESSAVKWNGILESNKIKCQWVLRFQGETNQKGNPIYTAIRVQRPAAYELEKYQTSGEKERDEYKKKYEAEIPYKNQENTYKIQDKICYVSYDGGVNWTKVPVPLEKLAAVGDGNPYFNKLQENSYTIAPEKTAFIYGGTREMPLTITYSGDKGVTWSTSEISTSLDSSRVKFCSFPTTKVGYVISSTGRTMSQEEQIIFKTEDGGETWKEVGHGPRTNLLLSGGFIDESTGFMIYPKIEGAKTNIYRTEDGGKTFEPITLPVNKQEWMGVTFEPFIQPETPYIEGDQLFLLVGQGPEGDFKGGKLMAKYKSQDKGKSWEFVELVEPPSREEG